MHHWIHRSEHISINAPPVSLGVENGCPFCRAREYKTPDVNQKIFFLSAGDIGQIGTRVNDQGFSLRSDQFAVKMPYDKQGHTRTVTKYLDLFVEEAFSTPPLWMPSFSIEDCLAIHEFMLRMFDSLRTSSLDNSIHTLIGTCWQLRIPISGNEMLPILSAHGFDRNKNGDFERLFDFGFQLLIRTQGRPPIKRRKMAAFSRGKYLSKNARAFWIDHFGHD